MRSSTAGKARKPKTDGESFVEKVLAVVAKIPRGKVLTYGQVATLVGSPRASRIVGGVLFRLGPDSRLPWQRVINAQGKISLRADSGGSVLQRQLLEAEGIRFDAQGRVNLRQIRWRGPQLDWLLEQGYDPAPSWREE